ncbi:MAG: LamG-like jellyroll fold domain-containing protein [Phycisphaerae bacterium]
MKKVVLCLIGLGMALTFPTLAAATPPALIFGADYNYSGIVKANESITGNTNVRALGSGSEDSFGFSFQIADGKWGGGMEVLPEQYSSRVRYDVPDNFSTSNGMVEVWFKMTGTNNSDTYLIDLGGGNYLKWEVSSLDLVAVLAGATVRYHVGSIDDNAWHHAAMSWGDGGHWKTGKRLWFDGYERAWNTGHTTALSGVTHIGVGAPSYGGVTAIIYDELHVYDVGYNDLVYFAPNQGEPGYYGEVEPLATPYANPPALIFGADYNYSGVINANMSINGSTLLRPDGSGEEDSFGDLTSEATGYGKWGGGLRMGPSNWNSRARYDVPDNFSTANGMAEVWFKMMGNNDSDTNLIDLGGGNFLRWEASSGDLVAVLAGATLRYNVGQIDNDTWHHAAMSWGDGGHWKTGKRLWFDGYERAWNTGHTTALSGISHVGVGAISYGGNTVIMFDELHVYDSGYNDLVYWSPNQGEPGYYAEVGPLIPLTYSINTAAGTPFSPGVRGHHPECIGVHRGEYTTGIPKLLPVSDGTFLRGLAAGLKAETYDWRNRFEYGVPANGLGQPTIEFLRYQRDRNSSMINTVNTRGLTRQVGQTCEYYDTRLSTLVSLATDWVRYTNHIVQTYRLGDTISDPRDAGIVNSLSWKTQGDTSDQFEPLLFPQEAAVPKVTYWEIGNEPSMNLSATNSYTLTPAQFHDRYAAIAAAMKAEDPTIKVGPSDLPGGDYINAVVSDLSLPVDVVYYHTVFRGNLGTTNVDDIISLLNGIYWDERSVMDPIVAIIAASGRDPATIPLAITEWNPDYAYMDAPSIGRMAQALGCMQAVFSFARMGIFDANYLKWPADTRDGMEYPVYKAWQVLNDHMGDTLVDFWNEACFQLYTTKDNATGQVAVWGLNFSNTTDKTMQISLDQLPPGATNVTWKHLGALSGLSTLLTGNISAYDAGGPQVNVDWKTWDLSGISTSSLTFHVPRASMCVLLVGSPSLKVSPQTQTVFWPAAQFNITVNNSGAGTLDWTAAVISGASWLSIGTTSGTDHGTITVSADENSTAAARTGIIRVTSGAVSKDVTVVQSTMPPTSNITSPLQDNTSTAPATIAITDNATDSNGTINKVEFYNNDVLLGTDNNSSGGWTYSWANVAASGDHGISLTAKAYDNDNMSTTSNPVTITVTDSALKCYWKLDNTSGTTAVDSSGIGNVGTTYNSPSWVTGKISNCLSFDGSNDYVQKTSASSLPAANANQTECFWFYVSSNPSAKKTALAVTGSSSAVNIGFVSSSGMKFGVWKYNNTVLVKAAMPAAGAWHHAAYTKSGSTNTLYIDGSPVNTSTTSTNTASATTINAGRTASGAYYWPGKLDEIRIYNRALSATEIAALAQGKQ